MQDLGSIFKKCRQRYNPLARNGACHLQKILELHSFKYGFVNKLAGVEFYFEVK